MDSDASGARTGRIQSQVPNIAARPHCPVPWHARRYVFLPALNRRKIKKLFTSGASNSRRRAFFNNLSIASIRLIGAPWYRPDKPSTWVVREDLFVWTAQTFYDRIACSPTYAANVSGIDVGKIIKEYQINSLRSQQCPKCAGTEFAIGPAAGVCVNVMCETCETKYNLITGSIGIMDIEVL
jgi:hypothetical protein